MKRLSPRVIQGTFVFGVALIALAAILLKLLPTEAALQARPIALFSAPSHLAQGEHWVIVGSSAELPADFAVESNQAGVVVLETQRLSKSAVAARVEVTGMPAGDLLRAVSVVADIREALAIVAGQNVPGLSAARNFTLEDFVDGRLIVGGDRFLYGYLSATDGGLSAVRIHNRRTGRWHRREHALEKRVAARDVLAELPPGFEEVNVFETLPDTDGDGIFDFDEPEVEEAREDFLGVTLVPGENTLDVVALDEAGNASWETIDVFTTYTPPANDF